MPDFNSTVSYRDLRSVVGFPGYRVGDDGSVWTCWVLKKRPGRNTGTIRVLSGSWKRVRQFKWKNSDPQSKHLRVELVYSRIKKKYAVHRLVLEAFVGPCPDGMEACHFPDRNPENNRISNLRWDTKAANQADRIIHGTDCRGSKSPNAKNDEFTISLLKRDFLDGLGATAAAARRGVTIFVAKNVKCAGAWSHVVAASPETAARALADKLRE